MPTFSYKAKKGPIDTIRGDLNAESRAAAQAILEARGCTPVWVKEKETGGRPESVFASGRINAREVTVFTRQLASMLRSGVPILRSLATIAEQTEGAAFRRLVADLEATVRDGNMLSTALARHASVFPELYLGMVRSGESGGVLDTVLERLADAREKEDDIRRKIQSAAAYPVFVLVVGLVTVFVLLAFFLPRVTDLYRDYRTLPLLTRILTAVSGVFARYWHWMLSAFVLLLAIARRLASADRGRAFLDALKLRLPVVQRLVRESDIARFARTLALLVQAGISIDRALALSANTMRNAVLRGEVEKVARDTVQMGVPLSSGLKRTRHFPPFVANMVAVGEESGRLEDALSEVASFYEKDLDQRIRLTTSLLEPILILAVGAVVGFIVMAMLLPVFQIGTAL